MTNAPTLRILGVSGSLRRRSFNTALLATAAELVPHDVTVTPFANLAAIPHFDEDLEASGDPPWVAKWKEAIRGAHALLIATPEYNASVPGALKNAIDWGSRPYATSPLRGLPILVIGASPSRLGSSRAQQHLRDVLATVGAHVVPEPAVAIAHAPERFDAELRLVDRDARTAVSEALARLVALTRQRLTDREETI